MEMEFCVVFCDPVLQQPLVQKSIHNLQNSFFEKIKKIQANVSYYSYRPYEKSSMVYGIG
jgi:hypothetical protein